MFFDQSDADPDFFLVPSCTKTRQGKYPQEQRRSRLPQRLRPDVVFSSAVNWTTSTRLRIRSLQW